jgi:IMP dehydrogenase/GMP reductase
MSQEIKEQKPLHKRVHKRKFSNKNIDTKFDFNDILIEPSIKSDIVTRKEINVSYGNPEGTFHNLPLIAAPMDTVVSLKNLHNFMWNGINVCLPRGEYYTKHGNDGAKMIFNSYSLIEFADFFIKEEQSVYPSHVLIDIANGHMSDLVYVTKKAKEYYGKSMQLMVGNVANPQTYKALSMAGADYIRIGIGNGNGCLTTEQTGIGYPMASLVKECYEVSQKLPKSKRAKIVADGGMKKYADVIKALALGADYVMIGSIFNKALESSGQNYWGKIPVGKSMASWLYKKGYKVNKKFRGMSTKEVQKKWGNNVLKTSEGVVRCRPVEYTLSQWTENFKHYLSSAMSYTNSRTLEEFVGKAKYNKITEQSYNRYNK